MPYTRGKDGSIWGPSGKVVFTSGEPVRAAVRIGSLADGGVIFNTVGPTGLVSLYEIGPDNVARELSRDDFMARGKAGVAWIALGRVT